jgi:hypothetical protein
MIKLKPQSSEDFLEAIKASYPDQIERESYITQFGWLKNQGRIGPIHHVPIFEVKYSGGK